MFADDADADDDDDTVEGAVLAIPTPSWVLLTFELFAELSSEIGEEQFVSMIDNWGSCCCCCWPIIAAGS